MALFGRKNPAQSADEQALERYRYLLRTAPPETIEQAHAEAFAQLTPDQRRLVLQQLAEQLPASERPLTDQNALSPARKRWRDWRRAPRCGNRVLPSACSARPAAQASAA